MVRNNGGWLLAIYLLLSVYILPMFRYSSPDELVRWATAASLVEKGSFDIAWAGPLVGTELETVRTEDRVYSTEAPGLAVLATPVYAITTLIVGPPDQANLRVSGSVMRFAFATLPVLLLGLWLYARETDELSLAALLFASPVFVYSFHFIPQTFTAVILYLAFRFIYDQRYIMPWHCLISGLLCGLAMTTEYSATVIAAVIGCGLLFSDKRERYRRVVYFVVGVAPFIAALIFYDLALFGSPRDILSTYSGVLGVPSLTNFYLLLVSPSRGLFFAAPILLYALVAFFTARDTGTLRHGVKMAIVLVGIIAFGTLASFRTDSSFVLPQVVLLIPLLLDAFFDSEIYDLSNIWQGLLFAPSLVFCLLPVLTYPFAPAEYTFPHRDVWLPYLTLEHVYVSTLANIFKLPDSVWALVPVFLLAALVVYFVAAGMRRPGRFLVGFTIGAVAVGLYLFVPSSGRQPPPAAPNQQNSVI